MSDYPVLTTGSRGKAVIHLKAMLAAKGWPKYNGTDDEVMYAATAADLAVYQATNLGPNGRFLTENPGVVPGVADALTWQALEGAFKQRQGTPVPQLIQPVNSPRYKFVELLAKWHKDNVHEVPKGSNEGPVISDMQRFHGMRAQPWCAMTVNYAHYLTFGKTPPWGKNARVCEIYNYAFSHGLTVPVDRKSLCPGDILILVHGGLRSNGMAPDANGHMWTYTATDGKDILGLDGNSDDRVRASRRNYTVANGAIRLWPVVDSLKFDKSVYYEAGAASDR